MAGLTQALRSGFASVRENVVPMAVLWFLSCLLVFGYYHGSVVAAVLEPLSRWQTEHGAVAAFLNRVVFCGLIPGAFLLTVKALRPRRAWLVILAYCLWGGGWGVLCDWFFTFQAAVFGEGRDCLTLFKKTMVDQLVWNVFICTPVNALFFPWLARDFRLGPKRSWRRFLLDDCLVLLIANWIVWMPVSVAVYAFPLPLQIQLVGLASSFWMLVALRAAAKGGAR